MSDDGRGWLADLRRKALHLRLDPLRPGDLDHGIEGAEQCADERDVLRAEVARLREDLSKARETRNAVNAIGGACLRCGADLGVPWDRPEPGGEGLTKPNGAGDAEGGVTMPGDPVYKYGALFLPEPDPFAIPKLVDDLVLLGDDDSQDKTSCYCTIIEGREYICSICFERFKEKWEVQGEIGGGHELGGASDG